MVLIQFSDGTHGEAAGAVVGIQRVDTTRTEAQIARAGLRARRKRPIAAAAPNAREGSAIKIAVAGSGEVVAYRIARSALEPVTCIPGAYNVELGGICSIVSCCGRMRGISRSCLFPCSTVYSSRSGAPGRW